MAPLETISSGIEEISDDQLDSLFSSTPDTTVTANSLKGATDPSTAVGSKTEEPSVAPSTEGSGIEEVDLSGLFGEEGKAEEEEESTPAEDPKDSSEEEGKAKVETPKASPASTDSKEKGSEDPGKEASEDTGQILKSTVDYLVEQGLWADFDGREDLEAIDEETYAELVAKQDEYRVQQAFAAALEKSGPYGKAIFEYAQKGGDPEKLLSIFKAQEERKELNIETPEGQKEALTSYYKKLGWKSDKISKQLSRLEVNEELKDEAEDAVEALNDMDEKEAARIVREQEAYNRTQQEREEAFREQMSTTIDGLKGVKKSDLNKIKDFIFNYDVTLQNGQKVNKLYKKFAEIQSDPEKYIDFVRYVMDKDEYLKSIKTEVSNEATERAFKFVKRSASTGSKRGSQQIPVSRTDTSNKEVSLNWGF